MLENSLDLSLNLVPSTIVLEALLNKISKTGFFAFICFGRRRGREWEMRRGRYGGRDRGDGETERGNGQEEVERGRRRV